MRQSVDVKNMFYHEGKMSVKKKKKNNELHISEKTVAVIALCIIIFSLLFGGGFFEWVSCILNICMLLVLVGLFVIEKKINIAKSFSYYVTAAVAVLYLVVCLWSVDKGFAVLGFAKFLPILLFVLLLAYCYEEKELIISYIPVIGAVMTLLSAVAFTFDSMKEYVSVAGRLSGTFQYPNTYAAFLLVGLIILGWKERKDWLDAVYALIIAYGIYKSGSRTVYVLTALFVLVFLIAKIRINDDGKRRSYIICLVLAAAAIAVVVAVGLIGSGTGRLFSISVNASTFKGRLLYAKDALRIILKHPFGLGYYGYFFVQGEYQTGLYNVVNVHNEFLQMAIDIGIIPALLFFGMIIYNIVRKGAVIRDRMILLALLLHSLFDYDFQFISILLVLLLFVKGDSGRKEKAGALTFVSIAAVNVILIVMSVVLGLSVRCYNKGEFDKSVDIWSHNTMAKLYRLQTTEDMEECLSISESITEANKHISLAYMYIAFDYGTNGNIEEFFKYMDTAIMLDPYRLDNYAQYISMIYEVANIYYENGDTDSVKNCYEHMLLVLKKLEATKEKTDKLAWEIKDVPKLDVTAEMQQKVDAVRAILGN